MKKVSAFMDELQKEAVCVLPNISVTENGAIGYETSGDKLVDLNFMLSSMRNYSEDEIWSCFLAAYNENPTLSVLWLFFARDIRGGCGERRVFRAIFSRLAARNPYLATKLLRLIPQYGRWDDLIWLADNILSKTVQKEAFRIICYQFQSDLDAARHGKPVSLLGKWMKSENTSSRESRRIARRLREALGMTPRQYRKALSELRKAIRVVERQMSGNEWSEIDYAGVPSKAALIYRDAFRRHDGVRYGQYLNNVEEGRSKIHSGTLFPHEIVHAYSYAYFDETLEAQWRALPNYVNDSNSTLVVVDGSGSMMSRISDTSVTCMDVAQALGIYFAERLHGPYADTFITFSAHPQVVHLNHDLPLADKIHILNQYSECSNTNIEAVFSLVLRTAQKNHLKQEDLPANILIISDGEFDVMVDFPTRDHQAAFRQISDTYETAGYHLPRLVFWNVCSRTGTIPLTENHLGVALVSGFSPSICDMVMSSKLDPFAVLKEKLLSDRYMPVLKEMQENG